MATLVASAQNNSWINQHTKRNSQNHIQSYLDEKGNTYFAYYTNDTISLKDTLLASDNISPNQLAIGKYTPSGKLQWVRWVNGFSQVIIGPKIFFDGDSLMVAFTAKDSIEIDLNAKEEEKLYFPAQYACIIAKFDSLGNRGSIKIFTQGFVRVKGISKPSSSAFCLALEYKGQKNVSFGNIPHMAGQLNNDNSTFALVRYDKNFNVIGHAEFTRKPFSLNEVFYTYLSDGPLIMHNVTANITPLDKFVLDSVNNISVSSLSPNIYSQYFLAHYNWEGKYLWHEVLYTDSIKSNYADNSFSITGLAADSKDNIYISGGIAGKVFLGDLGKIRIEEQEPFLRNGFIIKLDAGRNFKWIKKYGGKNSHDDITYLQIMKDDKIYFVMTNRSTGQLEFNSPSSVFTNSVNRPNYLAVRLDSTANYLSHAAIHSLNSFGIIKMANFNENGEFFAEVYNEGSDLYVNLGDWDTKLNLEPNERVHLKGYMEECNRYYITAGLCGPVVVGNSVISEAGMHFVHINRTGMPDSMIYINVTTRNLSKPSSSFYISGDSMVVTGVANNYSWFDCQNGSHVYSAPYPEGKVFHPNYNGEFKVIATKDHLCTDTSSCQKINFLILNEPLENSQIYLYPNPAEDNLNITCPGACLVEISEAQGRIIREFSFHENTSLGLSEYQSGIYLVKVRFVNGVETFKVLKK